MRLEFHGGGSSKFWEPRVAGAKLTVRFGKIGTAGQTRDTKFATPAAAKAGLAKLVAEKTGKGYRPAKGGATKAKAAATPRPSAKATARRAALLALAKSLGGPRAAAVVREVTLAIDDPQRFLATTKHELFEDWDDGLAEVPWLALIEALDATNRLAEVDWKEAGDEVLGALGRIGGAAAKRALRPADDAMLERRRTDEALALFGKLLGAAELALLVLDKSSDSFPLAVVPAASVPALLALARAAGVRIQHWQGKDLAKLEAERARAEARDRSTNPWRVLVVENAHRRGTETEAESVLFELRHDDDVSLLGRIRAALPFAPPRDRPLIEMALALNEHPASRIARTTRDPALCLRALNNVKDDPRSERLGAAAVLAERLRIKPDGGAAHRQLGEALNLWDAPKIADAALARLPAADRERLARLADGLIRKGLYGLSGALRALANVGDATSLARLIEIDQREHARAAAYAKKHPSWSPEPWSSETDMPGTIARIRARLKQRR